MCSSLAHDGKVRHRTGQSQRRDVIMYIVYICISVLGQKKICGFPVSSYKNLGRVGRF